MLNPYWQSEFHPFLAALAALARENSIGVWLCGGGARTLASGLLPAPIAPNANTDIDITVSRQSLALARDLGERCKLKCVILNDNILPTARLILPQGQMDITQWRGQNLEADLSGRDFTCNALALEMASLLRGPEISLRDIIDPLGGLAHIQARRLVLAGPHALRDDPVRIMRAFRFQAELNFTLAPGLLAAARTALPCLAAAAAERLAQEWRLTMRAAAAQSLADMDEIGLLALLLPGWDECRGFRQNPYHHLDVLGHSLACVSALEEITGQSRSEELVAQALAQADPALLKTAALLHDIGKPPTARPKSPDWNSFYNHDKVGAILARSACLNLGLGPREADAVSRLVSGHMEPQHLLKASLSHPDLRPRHIRRFLYRHEHEAYALMLLAQADNMAGKGPRRPDNLEEMFWDLWLDVKALADACPPPPPLLNGRQVMAACSLPPGPEVGRLLRLLRDYQLREDLNSPDLALSLIKKWACRPDQTQHSY
ncbi:MAG: HD domain-containing protein [Desulfarculales bacterium]|jgi:poly(A) polymerase|nr:HD domain-containing protein [Desulfarculales bacterium]